MEVEEEEEPNHKKACHEEDMRRPEGLRKVIDQLGAKEPGVAVAATEAIVRWSRLENNIYEARDTLLLVPALIRLLSSNDAAIKKAALTALVACASAEDIKNEVEDAGGFPILNKLARSNSSSSSSCSCSCSSSSSSSSSSSTNNEVCSLAMEALNLLQAPATNKIRTFRFVGSSANDSVEDGSSKDEMVRNERVIRICVDHMDNVGVGWKIWESAIILARWWHSRQNLLEGKRVLELGAGVGLVGILAAPYCREIVISDCVDKLVEDIQYNLSLNNLRDNNVQVINLDWSIIQRQEQQTASEQYHRSPVAVPDLGRFEVIMGSALIYDKTSAMHLADVVHHYLHPEQGLFYTVTHRNRLGIAEFTSRAKALGLHCLKEDVTQRSLFQDFSESSQWQWIKEMNALELNEGEEVVLQSDAKHQKRDGTLILTNHRLIFCRAATNEVMVQIPLKDLHSHFVSKSAAPPLYMKVMTEEDERRRIEEESKKKPNVRERTTRKKKTFGRVFEFTSRLGPESAFGERDGFRDLIAQFVPLHKKLAQEEAEAEEEVNKKKRTREEEDSEEATKLEMDLMQVMEKAEEEQPTTANEKGAHGGTTAKG
ncbi:Methyltransferase-like protein 22 [Balamuthia mandrillaris]